MFTDDVLTDPFHSSFLHNDFDEFINFNISPEENSENKIISENSENKIISENSKNKIISENSENEIISENSENEIISENSENEIISKKISKKNSSQGEAWSPKEDLILVSAVKSSICSDWVKISQLLRNKGFERNPAMARNRYSRINTKIVGKNRCAKCGKMKRGHICSAIH